MCTLFALVVFVISIAMYISSLWSKGKEFIDPLATLVFDIGHGHEMRKKADRLEKNGRLEDAMKLRNEASILEVSKD